MSSPLAVSPTRAGSHSKSLPACSFCFVRSRIEILHHRGPCPRTAEPHVNPTPPLSSIQLTPLYRVQAIVPQRLFLIPAFYLILFVAYRIRAIEDSTQRRPTPQISRSMTLLSAHRWAIFAARTGLGVAVLQPEYPGRYRSRWNQSLRPRSIPWTPRRRVS